MISLSLLKSPRPLTHLIRPSSVSRFVAFKTVPRDTPYCSLSTSIALASGGTALADGSPATTCTSPTSCVTGDPVLASVDIQSATAATLSGTAMTFGSTSGVLPGNTVTGTETYSVGTNDAAGAYVTATWDDSEIVAKYTSGLVPATTQNNAGFTSTCGALGSGSAGSGANYDQGMVNLNTIGCSQGGAFGAVNSYIPWSAISVTPASGAGGTAATFAYSSTGGVDPVETGGTITNNWTETAGQGGGSTIATVASFSGPVTTESLTDTYALDVPSSQEAGIYAADLWYQVVSN